MYKKHYLCRQLVKQECHHMDIVVCIDSNYVMPCGVMLYSICKNNQESDITFHVVVDESVNQTMQQSLENVLLPKSSKKRRFYYINGNDYNHLPRLDETNPKRHITKAAYYRLYLSEILPRSLDKVLYLDCDIIVRHSIKDLWNTDISNYFVGVVPDVGEGVIDKYNRLRYPPHKGYYNSGVQLINLKKWRDEHIIIKFVEFMQNHPDWIKLHDQDVMNRIFCDSKFILPITYNFQEGFLWKEMFYDYWKYEKQVLDARRDPIILHFTDSKPWIEACEHPFKEEFFKYQRKTEWAGAPLLPNGPIPSMKDKIINYIKSILRQMKIISPLPLYPSKYINIDNHDK